MAHTTQKSVTLNLGAQANWAKPRDDIGQWICMVGCTDALETPFLHPF